MGTVRSAAFSPDGRWLAFEADGQGSPEIFVAGFAPSGPTTQPKMVGAGQAVRWSAGSNELFFRSGDRLMVLPISNSGDFRSSGSPKELFRLGRATALSTSFEVSPGGDLFYFLMDQDMVITIVLNWEVGLGTDARR